MDLLFRKKYKAKNSRGEFVIKAYSLEGAKNKLRDIAITAIANSQGSFFVANVNDKELQKALDEFEIELQP